MSTRLLSWLARDTASLLLFFCTSVFSAVLVVGPNDYLPAIAGAAPGSVINLKSGNYYGGLPITELNGTQVAPIIIQAADPSHPPRFIAHQGRNTISIVDSSYLIIRNLLLDGRNLPVDAVKAEGFSRYAHHITLERLHIVGHGANQGVVGISTKCPAWEWVIRGNVIARAGTGVYLGNSDGSAPFFAGLIEGNLIYDTLGYNLQIKHQHVRPANTDISPEPHLTIIRHNVFSKFGNAAAGRQARPNVLVGHFPKEGRGADDRYAIYANFFYANPVEALFQGEGNVALYANLFVNLFGDAVHVQPHNDVPKNIWIFHNTVIANGAGIELSGAPESYLKLLAGNIVFAAPPGTSRLQTDNLANPLSQAEIYLNDPLAPPSRLDLTLKSALMRMAEPACIVSDLFPDAGQDFDGIAYRKCEMGAYAAGVAPAQWRPSLSLKPLNH